jgi:hypothetical protein
MWCCRRMEKLSWIDRVKYNCPPKPWSLLYIRITEYLNNVSRMCPVVGIRVFALTYCGHVSIWLSLHSALHHTPSERDAACTNLRQPQSET